MNQEKKSLGFMYLARRPCGKVSAMSWDDPGYKRGINKSIKEWVERGDSVVRVERFEGDPIPEMMCRPGCGDCRAKTA